MEENEIVELVDSLGNKKEIEVVTYLTSPDKLRHYVVYTKGERRVEAKNRVIYVSKIYKDAPNFRIEEITSDAEWSDVQRLLKQIANAD